MTAVNIRHRIAELAESQHGLLTRTQIYETGGDAGELHHLLRSRQLHAIGRNTFRVAGAPVTWEQRALAMVLQHEGLVVVSHRSAAALWGMPGMKRQGRIHITQLPSSSHGRPLPRIHQAPWLTPDDVDNVQRIPVMKPAPLLFQLAAGEHRRYLARLIDHALTHDLVTPDSLRQTATALCTKGRPGTRAFRSLVEERTTPGYVATASELEAAFLRIVRSLGLPEPVKQHNTGGTYWVARVDFAYPALKLVFELDGRRYHTALLDRDRDLRRDNELVRAGLRVVRLQWHELKHERAWVEELLHDLVRPLLAA
jgi:very-short-patch-repair endonuclease